MNTRLHARLRGDFTFLCDCEFYVPDGWFVILYQAMQQISSRLSETSYDIRANVISVRRDASLSIGIECCDDEVDRIIENTELKAETACMVCGKLGKRREPNYMEVLCGKHQNVDGSVITEEQVDELIAAISGQGN